MKFQSIEELVAWNPPNVVQYIHNDLLQAETKLCLFAAPKLYKSLLAKQLSFCIASGTPWIGFDTTVAKVALLQSEIPQVAFRSRVLTMRDNVIVPRGNLYFRTDRNFKLDRRTDINELRAWLKVQTPQVLILDPWYKMLSQEDNTTYSRTQDNMDNLIDEFKLSIVVVHHDTVPPRDTSATSPIWFHPRGPRTVEGWFDTIIQVSGDIATDKRTLQFETRNARNLIPPIEIELNRVKLWAERI